MAAEEHKLAIFRGLLKFKSNQQNLNDVERIPAYMRQGLEVDLPTKSNEQPSSLRFMQRVTISRIRNFLYRK